MALYHKWDVKNDFAYVLQFLSLISDSLGSVFMHKGVLNCQTYVVFLATGFLIILGNASMSII